MLWRLLTCVSDIPERRSSTTCSRSMSSRALPICLPSSRARRMPAFTRSTIRLRSNSHRRRDSRCAGRIRPPHSHRRTSAGGSQRFVSSKGGRLQLSQRLLKSSPCMWTTFLVPASSWRLSTFWVQTKSRPCSRSSNLARANGVGVLFHASARGVGNQTESGAQSGIAVPSLGRCDLFDSVVPPKSTHATESWDAAFGAQPCSRENEDTVGGGNCEHF
jgi:hypothetical protein